MPDPLVPSVHLAIVTVMHGRYNLTRLWAEYTVGFGLPVFASITEGDPVLASICEEFGITYIACPNEPLGAKHNAALGICDAARVMLLPSDDFVAPAWIDKALETDVPYLYPDSCGLFDVETRRACILHNHGSEFRKFGAGRVIRRDVIDRVGPLWSSDKPRGLDTDSHDRIMAAGFPFQQAGIGGVPVVDIKAGENLWRFKTVSRGGAIQCEPEVVMAQMRPEFRQRLLEIC